MNRRKLFAAGPALAAIPLSSVFMLQSRARDPLDMRLIASNHTKMYRNGELDSTWQDYPDRFYLANDGKLYNHMLMDHIQAPTVNRYMNGEIRWASSLEWHGEPMLHLVVPDRWNNEVTELEWLAGKQPFDPTRIRDRHESVRLNRFTSPDALVAHNDRGALLAEREVMLGLCNAAFPVFYSTHKPNNQPTAEYAAAWCAAYHRTIKYG